jgi:ABC-type amino acid transport system permease subunit
VKGRTVSRHKIKKTARKGDAWIMNWLIARRVFVVRGLAWFGILAIVILSVVPRSLPPVTGWGHQFKHFVAFALVAGIFAIGYRLPLMKLLVLAFLFCGGIELLQLTLATRHARLSDFVIDFFASCLAIGLFSGEKIAERSRSSVT